MEYFGDILLTVLCVAGLALAGWWLLGRLLCPVSGPDLWAVVYGRGGGDGLEQKVRALMWLRGLGLLRCPVAIVDGGLDEAGRAVAQRLAGRWPAVSLLAPGQRPAG